MTNVEFRDGERLVPDHVAAMMSGIDTHRLTYDQAIEAANQQLLRNQLNLAQRSAVSEHFRSVS
jgi:hypothetical protein